MSDLLRLLELALNPERSTAERRRSLADLKPLLHDGDLVLQLLAAARAELSVEMRTALLDVALDIDVTRIADRAAYFDALAYFASLEPESSLRKRVIKHLGPLAGNDAQVETVIAETLVCDLDPGVQRACLAALSAIPRKSERTVAALLECAHGLPRGARLELVALYASLEREPAQLGLASLLHVWEDADVQACVLDALAPLASFDGGTTAALTTYLTMQPEASLAARAVHILASRQDLDASVLEAAVLALDRSPHRLDLLAVLRDRLTAQPGLLDRLADLIAQSRSARLKLHLMQLLQEARQPLPFIGRLRDASAWVRSAAITWCAAHVREHTDLITTALAAAIPDEPLRALRQAMVRALIDSGRKAAQVENMLIAWFARESDPRIEASLATVLIDVPIDDGNRAELLRAYRKILEDPVFDDEVKKRVTERLRTFAYRDEPELLACLRTQLERATRIESVDELHAQLRRLDPNVVALAPTLLTLFYRFLHHFPRAPLHDWLADFRDAAKHSEAIRAQLPYLVAVSGASFLLEGAEAPARKQALLPTFMEAVRSNAFRAPQNLLREAYQSRTLRKSDLIAICDRLLVWPGQEALLQSVFEIMTEARLATAEIVDRCIDSLHEQPQGGAAHEIQKFLAAAAKHDTAHRDRILACFTQERYTHYCRRSGAAHDLPAPPRTWHDFAWQGSRLMHRDWPLGTLALELASRAQMRDVLLAPTAPDVLAVQTIHYVVLDHWWQLGGVNDADDYRALGELMRQSAAPHLLALLERALALFAHRWNEFAAAAQRAQALAADLAVTAADAYAALCQRHARLRKTGEGEFPTPLRGLDVARLEQVWPLARGLLASVVKACRIASPADEAEAERVWTEYAQALSGGDKDRALACLDTLLGPLSTTARVRSRVAEVEATRAQLAAVKRLPSKAEEQHARALLERAQAARSHPEALLLLDELFQTFAHTECVTSQQRFLKGWHDKLRQARGQ